MVHAFVLGNPAQFSPPDACARYGHAFSRACLLNKGFGSVAITAQQARLLGCVQAGQCPAAGLWCQDGLFIPVQVQAWVVLDRVFQRVQGNGAEGGQLATSDGDQALLIQNDVVSRFFGWVSRATGHHRAHPGIGGHNVLCRQSQMREGVLQRFQQVGHFVGGDAGFGVQIMGMINVGGADQGHAFPWVGKHRPTIARVKQADRLRHGQAPQWQQQMAAAQWAQLGGLAQTLAQTIGPHAGGTDHTGCVHLTDAASFITQTGTLHAACFQQQAVHAGVVAQLRTV